MKISLTMSSLKYWPYPNTFRSTFWKLDTSVPFLEQPVSYNQEKHTRCQKVSVVRYLGKRLQLRLRNLRSLHLRSTCERRLRLHLHCTCEPGFRLKCSTTRVLPRFSKEIVIDNSFTRSDNAVYTYIHYEFVDFLHGVALSDLYPTLYPQSSCF